MEKEKPAEGKTLKQALIGKTVFVRSDRCDASRDTVLGLKWEPGEVKELSESGARLLLKYAVGYSKTTKPEKPEEDTTGKEGG